MRSVLFTDHAKADIASIWDYTEERWGRDQAATYDRSLEAACIDLASGDRVGVTAAHISPDYHKLHVGKHTVYYRMNDDTLEVIRILHQQMDVPSHID